ncbi:pyrroline-5-carboxylate reductase [Pseudoclavibacter caeni]|jgi:pyrroline-5-carboxylate reductase|uniref:Pyrroline-5-carboxylate reductase n=1 Tax=Pseudoclavibacter caeni TaxID=908846 RepID=A0A7C8FVD0_9MICO|nr:pyrroline-5-carboxylate reductase [Pseudoclavibacter caeni]KAB1633518.1 pyrroline-5-carboxylate reductase [Pseudoclavibacter caeni]NYJ96484.1 pyrroline-5-carboxylate reductase [Pseudoclavibacter caeni]
MTDATTASASTTPITGLPALAFLGVGSMNGAILDGVIASGLPVADGAEGGIRTTNRSAARADAIAARHPGVRALAGERDPEANRHAVAGAGIVLLGVKPYQVADVLAQVRDVLAPGTIVVSIASGVTIASIAAALPEGTAVLRVMPNTPASVGAGVTGLAAGPGVTGAQRALVHALFDTVGVVVELDEARIDELSAVSGSGPAYLFAFVEELEQAAQRIGFSAEDARVLADQTVIGAARLLAESGRTAEELRTAVTSPGGTTQEALAVLARGGRVENMTEALQAAVDRAHEMARENA